MKKILIKLINLYQITPLHTHSMCRFNPTCSEYMKECINEYGYKGIIIGIKRILRCHPFGKFGYDPVKKEGETI
ncbi:MAG: membrane protein insertion efficiency factor YidD [Bacilli bacterium]|nr:membrane protein insertion efficiency factor YidD [Bacilli bacterium]